MSAPRSRLQIGAVGVLAFLIAGCVFINENDGKPRAAVSGEVTFDGEPLSGATILFIKADSNSVEVASGQINSGRFSISQAGGPLLGLHKIRISKVVPGQTNPNPAPESGEPSKGPRQLIPEKYNNQTVLSAEITRGPPNELVFHLESD